MDNQTLIAIAALVLANIGTTIGLFTWSTNQATTATQNHREETNAILKGIADEMKQFHEEMKIIHGRVCTVEEKVKNKLQD
jgi:hypothetical protein